MDRTKKAKEALAKAREAREKAETQYEERVQKAEYQLKLAKETKDYNLQTSLKNYIDPRKYRDWGEKVGYDWTKLYTTALQRKFKWAQEEAEEYDADNGDGEEGEVEETTAEQKSVAATSGDGNAQAHAAEQSETRPEAEKAGA